MTIECTKILCVDAFLPNTRLLAEVTKSSETGLSPIEAEGGEHALDLIRVFNSTFLAVITNIDLEQDGPDGNNVAKAAIDAGIPNVAIVTRETDRISEDIKEKVIVIDPARIISGIQQLLQNIAVKY